MLVADDREGGSVSKKQSKPNWAKIQAEYIAGGTSYRLLCAKYGVPMSTLRRHATSEQWVEKAAQVKHEADVAIHEAAVSTRIDAAADFETLAAAMTQRIAEAIERCDTSNAKAVNLLTDALATLQRIQGLNKDSLDKAEQQARIDKLRKDSESSTTSEVTVSFAPDVKEYGV